MHYYQVSHCSVAAGLRVSTLSWRNKRVSFSCQYIAVYVYVVLSSLPLHSLQLKLNLTTSPNLTSSSSMWRYMYVCVDLSVWMFGVCRFVSVDVLGLYMYVCGGFSMWRFGVCKFFNVAVHVCVG